MSRQPSAGINRWWAVSASAATVAALAMGGVAALQGHDRPVPEMAEICRAYDELQASLNIRTLGAQVRIRATEARLADLTQRYPEKARPVGLPVHAAAERLRATLRAPYRTARDVFSAACPAAEACGQPAQCRENARLDPGR